MFSKNGDKVRHIAMILHGCGMYDGTDIHEATSLLIHLDKNHIKVTMFAPNCQLQSVINHINGQQFGQERNVLIESGRIARGQVKDIKDLKSTDYDALLIPGGHGIDKNLSVVEANEEPFIIRPDVEKSIKEFLENHKPIGLSSIASILMTRLVPGVQIAMGKLDKNSNIWKNLKKCHTILIDRAAEDIHIDKRHKIVTTPAYMGPNATPYNVFLGIGKLIDALISMI